MARSPTVASWNAAPWNWALGGALCGLVMALVLFAPARWLAEGLASVSGGQVRLDDARGTVWDGSARLVLTGGARSNDALALPGRTAWHLRPAAGGIQAELLTECCTALPLVVSARPSWGGMALQIEDGRSEWPAAVLAGLGAPWNTMQIEGSLALSTQGLSVEWIEGRLAVAGRAELTALRLSSRLSTLKPMGSYRITINGGPTPTVGLDTLEGALQLAGSGSWVGSRLRFEGVATAAPEREAALSNLLNILGRRSGARSILTIG